MRSLLHLLSVGLVLPVLTFASGFVILGRAIAAGSLLGLFDQLLTDAAWLVPWGFLAAAVILLVLAVGGLFVQTRWLAGLSVAVIGAVSTVIVLVLGVGHSHAALDQIPFFVPGVVGSCIGAWFALKERPGRHRATSTA